MWRVDIYDTSGKLLCYKNVPTQAKAKRVALSVTRHAKVTTEVTKVQHHETPHEY